MQELKLVFYQVKFLKYLPLIFLFIQSCNKTDSSIYEKSIINLKTKEAQRIFLEEIYNSDQKVRKDNIKIEEQYGYDSPEVKASRDKMINADKENFAKIVAYLNKYSHPKKATHGETAARTPWIVFHHTTDLEIRDKYFKILHEAYENGDLSASSLSLYLYRTHSFRFNESFRMPSPYREEQYIDSLVQKLGLQEKLDGI